MTHSIEPGAPARRPRVDSQLTGLAGELFVAAELLKRGYQCSVTFGNAKAIDLIGYKAPGPPFTVQVKALKRKGFFPLSSASVDAQHVYAFVILNGSDQAVDYYIVSGEWLSKTPSVTNPDPKFNAIYWSSLVDFKDNWGLFETIGATLPRKASHDRGHESPQQA